MHPHHASADTCAYTTAHPAADRCSNGRAFEYSYSCSHSIPDTCSDTSSYTSPMRR